MLVPARDNIGKALRASFGKVMIADSPFNSDHSLNLLNTLNAIHLVSK